MPKPPRSRSSSPPQTHRNLDKRPDIQYAPLNPSRLRSSVVASAESLEESEMPDSKSGNDARTPIRSSGVDFATNGGLPRPEHAAPLTGLEGSSFEEVQGRISEPTRREADVRTRLLENYHRGCACGLRHCNHGTFSPDVRSSGSSISSHSGSPREWPDELDVNGNARDGTHGLSGDTFADGVRGQRTYTDRTMKWLGRRHGIKNSKAVYES